MANFMNFSANVKNAFENKVEEYKNFSKLLVDAANNKLEVYSAEEANTAIVNKFNEVLGVSKGSSKRDIRYAIKENQLALFKLIEETLEDLLITGWQDDPFFKEYVDVRNLALGDKNEFYTSDDSILSVYKVSGNHHDIVRQRFGAGTTTSISTSWFGVKIYAEFERMITGVETWAEFVQKIYKAYDKYINDALYTALKTDAAAISSTFKGTGALSASTLLALCENVQMATGYDVAILGTKTALSKVIAIQDTNWISTNMKDEKNRTGIMSVWEGIDLVELKQGFQKNDISTKLLDDDHLFIMPKAPNKFLKLVNEGEARIDEVADKNTNMDMTYEYEVQEKLGVGVVANLQYGFWDI